MTCRAYWFSCCVVRSPCSASHITATRHLHLEHHGRVGVVGQLPQHLVDLGLRLREGDVDVLGQVERQHTEETPGDDRDWMKSIPGTLLTAVSTMS